MIYVTVDTDIRKESQMQLHSENNQLTTNLRTKAHVFTIHASAKAFKILSSNLYKFKIAAIIRELSCNALDSHVDAGNDEPFVVHLPTQIEPFFSVEDFGTGMSPEQIGELYTGYFASSKTERNDQIGALGLGSKSPFAYTDMFTIDSIKNGVKSTYSAFLDPEGMPTYMLVKSEETSAHNGVRITFPVPERDFREFCQEAATIFWAFTKRPKITGAVKLYAEYTSDFEKATSSFEGSNWKIYKKYPDIVDRKFRYDSGALVRMGNIIYPINSLANDQQFQDVLAYINNPLIIDMPLGSCDINPSREELSYDQLTKDNIHEQLVLIHKELEKQASEKINNSATVWEAAKTAREYFSTILRDRSAKIQFTYKGTTYTYGQPMATDAYAFMCNYESGRRGGEMTVKVSNSSNPMGKLEAQLGHNFLIVVAGAKDVNSQYLRTRVKLYCKQQKMPETIIRIVTSISDKALEELGNPPVVKYENLPKTEYVQRTQALKGKVRSYYSNNEVDITALPSKVNVYIIDYRKQYAINENYKGAGAKIYGKKNDEIGRAMQYLFRDGMVPKAVQKKIYVVPYKLFDELGLAKNKNWISFETLAKNACSMFLRRYKDTYIAAGREEETISFYNNVLQYQSEFEKADFADGSPMKASLELLKSLRASNRTNAKTYEIAKTVLDAVLRIDQYINLGLKVMEVQSARNAEKAIDTIRIFHNYPMISYMLAGSRYNQLGLNGNTLRVDIGNQQMSNVDKNHVKAMVDVIEYIKMVDKSNGIG